MTDISRLVRKLDQRDTVIFLGAGASVSSRAPSGSDLALKLSMGLGVEVETADLEKACRYLEERSGRQVLVNELRSIFLPLKPGKAYIDFARSFDNIIISTNYDDLVEKAYLACNKPLSVINSSYDIRLIHKPGPKLLKLHGSIREKPSNESCIPLVLTPADRKARERNNRTLYHYMVHLLSTYFVVFVGFSFSDGYLWPYFSKAVWLQKQQCRFDIHAVVHGRNLPRMEMLRKKGISAVNGSFEEFTGEWCRHYRPPLGIEQYSGGIQRKKIMKSLFKAMEYHFFGDLDSDFRVSVFTPENNRLKMIYRYLPENSSFNRFRAQKPVLLTNRFLAGCTGTDKRPNYWYSAYKKRLLRQHHASSNIHHVITVPVPLRNGSDGVLCVDYRNPARCRHEDVQVLRIYARWLGEVI